MNDDTAPPPNSASPLVAGRHWPCLCNKPEHSVFLPADVEPEGLHGSYHHVVNGRRTTETYFRIHTARCARDLGTAPVASIQKAPRKPAERPAEPVREAGAA